MRLFHCRHCELEFVFLAFLFSLQENAGLRALIDFSCTPWFWFSPHCSSCLFITEICVEFNAVLVSCTCSPPLDCPPLPGPGVPKGDGVWSHHHPFMLQMALSGPGTSSAGEGAAGRGGGGAGAGLLAGWQHLWEQSSLGISQPGIFALVGALGWGSVRSGLLGVSTWAAPCI